MNQVTVAVLVVQHFDADVAITVVRGIDATVEGILFELVTSDVDLHVELTEHRCDDVFDGNDLLAGRHLALVHGAIGGLGVPGPDEVVVALSAADHRRFEIGATPQAPS